MIYIFYKILEISVDYTHLKARTKVSPPQERHPFQSKVMVLLQTMKTVDSHVNSIKSLLYTFDLMNNSSILSIWKKYEFLSIEFLQKHVKYRYGEYLRILCGDCIQNKIKLQLAFDVVLDYKSLIAIKIDNNKFISIKIAQYNLITIKDIKSQIYNKLNVAEYIRIQNKKNVKFEEFWNEYQLYLHITTMPLINNDDITLSQFRYETKSSYESLCIQTIMGIYFCENETQKYNEECIILISGYTRQFNIPNILIYMIKKFH